MHEARKALILVHGRGGSAADMLRLAGQLEVDDFALLAPQATHYTWYPQSFLAPEEQNEPWLSSAVDTLRETVRTATDAGILPENIWFFGFSQGACLVLEFVARHATRYGGVVALIGGLIGEQIHPENYSGDFAQTPVFLGTSNPDFHVPVERVQASADLLTRMNASVTLRIYENYGHTIYPEQLDLANKVLQH